MVLCCHFLWCVLLNQNMGKWYFSLSLFMAKLRKERYYIFLVITFSLSFSSFLFPSTNSKHTVFRKTKEPPLKGKTLHLVYNVRAIVVTSFWIWFDRFIKSYMEFQFLKYPKKLKSLYCELFVNKIICVTNLVIISVFKSTDSENKTPSSNEPMLKIIATSLGIFRSLPDLSGHFWKHLDHTRMLRNF